MVKKIRTILVDDEESARNILSSLLTKFCPLIELTGIFKNVEEAVEGIKTIRPQLVFLDIEMPNYTGFEIIDFFEDIDFKMIFVTAYDKYAIKAFEVSAVDYLLKPIEIERLQEAVERASKQIDIEQSNERIGHLRSALKNDELSSLIVTDRGYQYVLDLENIIALEARESYCCIHTGNKSYIASKNLKHFEKLLADNKNFIRVHKSWIINLDHMLKYSRSTFEINLSSGIVAKLSKYKKTDFEALL